MGVMHMLVVGSLLVWVIGLGCFLLSVVTQGCALCFLKSLSDWVSVTSQGCARHWGGGDGVCV
jgi:hypothetical protein